MYYLPININGRRLHFLKLKAESVNPVFSFIVKDQDSPTLLSIDTEEPQLISTDGCEHNKSLANHQFVVEPMANTIDGLTAYEIKIVKQGKTSKIEETPDLFIKASGYLGADDLTKFASIKIDSTLNRTANNEIKESEFVLVISYNNGDKTYRDALKICLYANDSEMASAALDFGSEASQIRIDGVNTNSRIIEQLLKFGYYDAPEFWQGKSSDDLYKSIFFINTKPDTTNYAERPRVGESGAFVHPLMAVNARDYDNLELLPNLKLVEIGKNAIKWTGYSINFNEDTKIDYGNVPVLASEELRNSILRLILSNFLHCILSQTCNNRDKFVRIVLLVPNVYYQSKIYRLMDNLYRDFKTIQNSNRPYNHCKGIEVQVVSESDASFLGVKSNRPDLDYRANGHYLIIDAGKGTTDFSILQTAITRNQFNSLYRDGIPASGNVITYAFYEALRDYMIGCGVPIEEYIRNAQNSELLQFSNLMDQLKKDYSATNTSSAIFTRPNRNDIKDMAALIQYLKDGIKDGKKIPGCSSYVDNKIGELVTSLEESLNNFMMHNNIQFIHVLLSGRGFLFNPFKQAIIEMLKRNQWITNAENAVVRIEGDLAKTLCLYGALAIEKECSVNCNSGLIGSPIIKTEGNILSRTLQTLLSKFKIGSTFKPLDMNFFYQGSDSASSQQLDVIIGGRKYMLGSASRQTQSIFFVGEGFLHQTENHSELILEKNFAFASALTERLVDEALFPYNIANINNTTHTHTHTAPDPEIVPEEKETPIPTKKDNPEIDITEL